jgi:extracellular elastinolytic metalloproteinase
MGKGGIENDRVDIYVQNSTATDNAGFLTPSDGQPGEMYLYLWTYTTVSPIVSHIAT